MDPNTPTTPTQTPLPPQPPTEVPTPVEPPVKVVTGGARNKKPLWIAIALVILIIIVGGFILATSGNDDNKNNKKAATTTTAKNNLVGSTGNTDATKVAIQGISVTADASKDYTPDTQSVSASDLQSAFEKKGLTDYFAFTGETAYDSTDGHSAISAAWGTIGKSYNHNNFMQKVSDTGDTTGATKSTVTNLASQTIKGSDGKTYKLTCSILTLTNSGVVTNTLYCDGAIGSTGYLLISDSSDQDSTTVQTAVQAFLAGTTLTVQ